MNAGAGDEDGAWSCVACTFIVAPDCELCVVCHTKRPSGAELAAAVDAAAAIRTANEPVLGAWAAPLRPKPPTAPTLTILPTINVFD